METNIVWKKQPFNHTTFIVVAVEKHSSVFGGGFCKIRHLSYRRMPARYVIMASMFPLNRRVSSFGSGDGKARMNRAVALPNS
jgi:hypothetical protein